MKSNARKVAEKFVGIHLYGTGVGPSRAGNLYINGYFIMSWDTPIALYRDGRFYVATKRYSVTTSSHRNNVVAAITKLCPSMLCTCDTILGLDCITDAERDMFRWARR